MCGSCRHTNRRCFRPALLASWLGHHCPQVRNWHGPNSSLAVASQRLLVKLQSTMQPRPPSRRSSCSRPLPSRPSSARIRRCGSGSVAQANSQINSREPRPTTPSVRLQPLDGQSALPFPVWQEFTLPSADDTTYTTVLKSDILHLQDQLQRYAARLDRKVVATAPLASGLGSLESLKTTGLHQQVQNQTVVHGLERIMVLPAAEKKLRLLEVLNMQMARLENLCLAFSRGHASKKTHARSHHPQPSQSRLTSFLLVLERMGDLQQQLEVLKGRTLTASQNGKETFTRRPLTSIVQMTQFQVHCRRAVSLKGSWNS